MDILINKDEISNYIPQRNPIVMVDKFFGITDEGVSISGLRVEDDNIFCKDGVLDECGLIEHIAQSAALRVGFIAKKTNKDIPLGYIGALKNVKMHKNPKVGDEILTYIKIEHEVFDITLISAFSKCNKDILVECEMKIFLEEL